MQVYLHQTVRYLLWIAMVFGATSCEWVKDDLPECPPTELRLRFEYDYNMIPADIFKDQVGGVTVFVFDENGSFVTQKSESSPELLGKYGYEMVFDESDLELDREYRFVTIAYQDDEQKLLQEKGAKFRRPEMKPGDDIRSLYVKLDRSAEASTDGTYQVENQECPLDILWINRNDCRAMLRLQQTAKATLNLMRHTNNLTVTLRQLDDPADIDIDEYEIRITDRNGWVDYDNSLREDDLLAYTPYACWNTEFKEENIVVERAAHADLSFPRLIYNDDKRKNARLLIIHKETKARVADINLPDLLADDRSSLEIKYGPQEFLDREYVYKLDFFLNGGSWEYVNITISIGKWNVRNQSTEL